VTGGVSGAAEEHQLRVVFAATDTILAAPKKDGARSEPDLTAFERAGESFPAPTDDG
jgi:hypothetical protein